MTEVKIHFWSGSGFIGKAIQLFTWGKMSHVAMQIGNILYEAREFKGVVKSQFFERDPKPTETLILQVTEEQKEKLLAWWEIRIGWGYDYIGVFRFLSTVRFISKKLRLPFWFRFLFLDRDNTYFCSEAVAEACSVAGIQLFKRIESSKISPAKLYTTPILREENE